MTSDGFGQRGDRSRLVACEKRIRTRSLLDITAGKIDAANRAIAGVRPHCGAGTMKCRVENDLAMSPLEPSVVDDERDDDVACRPVAVGNIFAPTPAPNSVAADSLSRAALIRAGMSKRSRSLIGHMFRGGHRESCGKCQRLDRPDMTQESNRLIHRAQSFARAPHPSARLKEKMAVKSAAHLLEKRGVKLRILPGQIQLADDGAAGSFPVQIVSEGGRMKEERKEERESETIHLGRKSSPNARGLTLPGAAANFPALPRAFR